ncbi:MAG: hypothetical protein HY896_10110 [Deltaproteobacteria bacterium]|nr:hypothetical protein [Deltaproteobacteria bacterium]
MKPRDVLNKKKKTYLLIAGISFAALTMLAFVEKYLPKSLFDVLAIGAGTVFGAGIVLVYLGIKCPKCGKTLGLKFVFADDTLHHCPGCGIPFDEDSL